MSYIIVGQQTKPRPFRKACLRAAGWIVCSFAAFGSATLILTIIVLRRRIWRTPLFHLLFKAWQSLVSSISTNTLGFVMEIALSVIVFVTTLFVVLLRTEKGERSRALRTSLIAAAATAVVTLCFWSAMFGWNVIKTVYDDHQKEQSEARTLTAKNNSLASDNKGLGNVETAKSAAPRISKPTKLGDVVSIHQTGGITAGTVNIDQPPPPHVEWTQERLPSGVGIKETGPTTWIGPPLGSIDRKNPGAKIRLAVDHSWPNAFFFARCDKPCEGVWASADSGFIHFNPFKTNKNDVVAMRILMPSPLPAGDWITWEIRSSNDQDIHIEDVGLLLEK